jgi:hypothetical protein
MVLIENIDPSYSLTQEVVLFVCRPESPLAVQVGDDLGRQSDVVPNHLPVTGEARHGPDSGGNVHVQELRIHRIYAYV